MLTNKQYQYQNDESYIVKINKLKIVSKIVEYIKIELKL